MMSIAQDASVLFAWGQVKTVELPSAGTYRRVYEENRHRIYSLAFWMTDHELAAEELTTNTFCRVFANHGTPTPEEIDHALVAELRRFMTLGSLTLNCEPCQQILSVRRNVRRVDLERAVMELPNTEKMIFLMHDVERYDHARIARTLHLSEGESRRGLHQARLQVREFLAIYHS